MMMVHGVVHVVNVAHVMMMVVVVMGDATARCYIRISGGVLRSILDLALHSGMACSHRWSVQGCQ